MNLSFTVKSHPNIALLKYWGQKNINDVLPANISVSFNINEFYTESQFFYGPDHICDEYFFDGDCSMALEHILRVRTFFSKKGYLLPHVRVISKNNFLSDIGMASSASSMSALTKGLFELARRFGAKFENEDLIYMTRLSGSASAVRSLGEGLVVYDPEKPYEILQLKDKFDMIDVTKNINSDKKALSSREGHKLAPTSFFYNERLLNVNDRYTRLMSAYDNDDFVEFGNVVEEEAISFLINHYTATPRMQYLIDESLRLVYLVKSLNLPVFFTFDAGSVPHFITMRKFSNEVKCA